MAKNIEYDPAKKYRATLTEGLRYNLGTRTFIKDTPQVVDGKVAEVLSRKTYKSDVTKSGNRVEAIDVAYFDLEEIDDEEAAAVEAALAEGKTGDDTGDKAPAKAAADEAPKRTRAVKRATTK